MARRLLLLLMPLGLIAARSASALDEPDELMLGRVLTIRTGQLVRFVAKSDVAIDLPDAPNAPTDQGGILVVLDSTGHSATGFSLPSSGWQGLGNPAGTNGYRFRGTGSPADPCTIVLIRQKFVKAVCRGTGALSPPILGEVGIRLDVAGGAKRYCTSFGGTTVKNDAELVKRRNAVAPVVCPFVTSSTGGTTSTSSTSTSTIDPAVCATTTTLGRPSCGLSAPGQCSGLCFNGEQCVLNPSGICECQGPALCGSYLHFCGGECPVGQACDLRPVPEGCGPIGCECR